MTIVIHLAGILEKSRPVSLFYEITVGTLFLMCILSLVTIAIKKLEAYQKERKLAKSINIMIETITIHGKPKKIFNHKKHNDPITDTSMLITGTTVFFGSFMLYFNSSSSVLVLQFWFGWAGNILFRTVLPIIIITFYHTHFRHFIWRTLKMRGRNLNLA